MQGTDNPTSLRDAGRQGGSNPSQLKMGGTLMNWYRTLRVHESHSLTNNLTQEKRKGGWSFIGGGTVDL